MHALTTWLLIFIGWVSTTIASTIFWGLIGLLIPSLIFLGLSLYFGLTVEDTEVEHKQQSHDGVYERKPKNDTKKEDYNR